MFQPSFSHISRLSLKDHRVSKRVSEGFKTRTQVWKLKLRVSKEFDWVSTKTLIFGEFVQKFSMIKAGFKSFSQVSQKNLKKINQIHKKIGTVGEAPRSLPTTKTLASRTLPHSPATRWPLSATLAWGFTLAGLSRLLAVLPHGHTVAGLLDGRNTTSNDVPTCCPPASLPIGVVSPRRVPAASGE